MTSGSSMHAMTRSVPPHFAQVSISMANTRFRRCIHVMGAGDGSGDGAAELFELVTLVGLAAGYGVPGKTRLRGEQG